MIPAPLGSSSPGEILVPEPPVVRREDVERARLGAILPRFGGLGREAALLQAQSEHSGDWLLKSKA